MRKIILLGAIIFISSFAFAQAPQGISYQAIARTSGGQPIANQQIDVGFKIYDDNPNTVGIEVYHEVHFTVTTNQFGLVTCVIGQGTIQTGSGLFTSIPWSNGHIWLEVGINAGSGMTPIGTQQFMSVPYALYSSSSSGPTGATGPTGPSGQNGANGIGTAGPTGPTGPTGLTGNNGTNGTNGATGPTGNNGTNGVTGPTGLTGNNGTNGTNGATGPTGNNGTNGTNGATGATGASGTNGTNGSNGATGATGASGTNGTNGSNGATGATGATGNANILGSLNFLVKFTGATTGGNSQIFDNATNVGVGNPTPGYKLDVGGDVNIAASTFYRINAIKMLGNSPGTGNLYVGEQSGNLNAANFNTFVGYQAGFANVGGSSNTYLGYQSGQSANSGSGNTLLGAQSGNQTGTGNKNTSIGFNALYNNANGSNNVALGTEAGQGNVSGSGNVFLGYQAGFSEIGSGKLYIANSSVNPPLIFGDFTTARVGIGTITPGNPLEVFYTNTGGAPAISINNTAPGGQDIFAFSFSGTPQATIRKSNGGGLFVESNNNIEFFTTGTPRVAILGSGNVGIGFQVPTSTFAIGNGVSEIFNIYGADGDMFFRDPQASITFPASSAGGPPMIHMFASGTTNPDRMVIAHGPANQSWGLQYQDVGDLFRFLAAGTPVFNINLANQQIQYPHSTMGSNKVLVSDATGNATWANSSINSGFSVYNSINQAIPNGSATTLNFNSEEFDDANAFAGNTYSAPSPGVYQFTSTLVWNPFTAVAGYTTIEIYKNGVMVRQSILPNSNPALQYNTVETSVTLKLLIGDMITVRAYQSSGAAQNTMGGPVYTRFSGFRVY